MSEAPEVLFERQGRAGIITLDRPAALNALTLSMVRAMHPQLAAWAADEAVSRVVIRAAGGKAFCAGGDIRALYEWGRAGDETFLAFYREEYRLDTFIKRFPKPYIALVDGIVMGGGVGVSVHGSHRIAGERLVFAMPETGIGLFPDVGGTYFLPRLPGETGMYLGLTGERVRTGDALALGIATHHVPSARFAELTEALCEAEDVDAVLAAFAAEAGAGPLAAERPAIDRHFSASTLDGLLQGLEEAEGEWARRTLQTLKGKSPTSLRITLRQLREGKSLDFEAAMRLEYRIVSRIFQAHDFFEGTRAVVIDKDMTPRWRPASLAEVTDADIEAYFAPLGNELTF